jgi:hypothetical protein
MIQCTACATCWEATVSNQEEVLVVGDKFRIEVPIVIPVWQCNICQTQWTDWVSYDQGRSQPNNRY